MSSLIVLKMVSLVVFLGWILVWLIIPTQSYMSTWSPKLNNKLNGIYIGQQGTNLWLLSFPIILISVLGCIYLHLKKGKTSSFKRSNKHMGFGKRPAFVVAPLGVVTGMELIFGVMFALLLVWFLANLMYMSISHPYMPLPQIWRTHFRSFWLRIGYVGNVCYAFLFIPVARGSSILPLFGLTSESSIKYHIWLGHISMVLEALHSLGFIVFWIMQNQMYMAWEWSSSYVSNLAGMIAFIISIPFWATSFPQVRRKMFEVFFYTHHLYILYTFFYILHVGVAYFAMILPGIFLFAIDRYLRFLQSRNHARLVSARLLPCDTVELNFAKIHELHYNPGSILFVHIPSISKMQWHPFTVNSNDKMEPETISATIKATGKWSRKLYEHISSPSSDSLQVSVEGPYGPSSTHNLRHESLVLISGGSGITPFISIIREIIIQTNTNTNNNKKQTTPILLICAFKHHSDLSMLDLLLPPESGSPLDLSHLQIQIKAFITRDHNPHESDDNNQNLALHTKWFKPNKLDSPITPVLGPDTWLWLCAIIVASFVMFLVLLGLVTRYYIYPIDHNTGSIYHYSYRCLWDMFFVCVSVVVVTSCVFLYHKRKAAGVVGNQIRNPEASTTSSPGSWFYGVGDRELESVPHQSLVRATQVQYGARPDLKKVLLLECKGNDVGVMVSGPREMRHEVARICSSGKDAQHLHFEALSFQW